MKSCEKSQANGSRSIDGNPLAFLPGLPAIVEECQEHNVPVGHPQADINVDVNNVESIVKQGYRLLMAARTRRNAALGKRTSARRTRLGDSQRPLRQ